MSNPFVVLLVVLLVAVAIYLLISLGIFGGAGKAARASKDDDETPSKQDGT